jgi:hypothetical protein
MLMTEAVGACFADSVATAMDGNTTNKYRINMNPIACALFWFIPLSSSQTVHHSSPHRSAPLAKQLKQQKHQQKATKATKGVIIAFISLSSISIQNPNPICFSTPSAPLPNPGGRPRL